MRIRSLETVPVGLPFREPYLTARGALERREMLIVRLSSEGGVVGHGDAVPMSLRGGPGTAEIRRDLEVVCRPILEAAELSRELTAIEAGTAVGEVVATCAAAGVGPAALSGVDCALLDLLGRELGAPAWKLLGARSAGNVVCNGTLGAGEPGVVAASARELAARGFTSLKVKVGRGEDLARMEAVRSACGPATALRVDANGAWSLGRAEQMLTAMEEAVGLELAEQPCSTLEELAELQRRVSTAIVADESVATFEDAISAQESGACEAATLKLAKVGGPHAALRIASPMPSYLSSALDSSLGIAAALHTAQALPRDGFTSWLAHGLATSGLFADNVADDHALLGPEIEAPSGPGLGVDVDPDAIERLRLR